MARGTLLIGAAGLAAVLAVGAGACGGPPRVPTGEPLTVVRGAPDATIDAGPAHVVRSSFKGDTETRAPLAAGGPATVPLDLLRGVVEVEPYGGQGIRGVSTMRYEVTIDHSDAVAATPATRRTAVEALGPPAGIEDDRFETDVWIDVDGRVRRVQIPDPLWKDPPATVPRSGFPSLVVWDYVRFG